jgi:hypothetical protein
VQAAGGLLLIAGVYFTWAQIQVSREGQVTERFTKAIEHLGSEELDVRLGGIFALERIARDSSADRDAVAQVLISYIRGHSSWQGSPKMLRGKRTCPAVTGEAALDALPTMYARKADVQAAMTVLSRRPSPHEEESDLVLVEADLRQSTFRDAYLFDADLKGTNLQSIDLDDAFLDRADFGGDPRFYCATHMEWASLRDASIREATLNHAYLQGADLLGTDFTGSTFCEAHIEGVDFSTSTLDETDFCGAIADSQTKWPAGFDPRAHGVVFAGS